MTLVVQSASSSSSSSSSSLITLPNTGTRAPSVRETLEYQIEACLEAKRRGQPEIATLLRGHALATGSDEEILAADCLTLETARQLVAREHEFRDWADAMAHGDETIDPTFEAAIDAIVLGNLDALEVLLAASSELARARSTFGHRATLLHHVAANGVEQTRQRSPPNAPAIASALLHAGADPDAECNAYGGTCTTTLELLVSSCHPEAAGVQADLVDVLCRGGAKVEGLTDDGAPLWTAITWGYSRSAERLVACGARVDNVISAAALGDLAQVQSYFDQDGRLRPATSLRGGRHFSHGRPFDLRHMLEYALIWAAGHGRRQVVEFLLSKGPDLNVKEPVYGSTAIGVVKYNQTVGRPNGDREMITLLDEAARR